MQASSKPVELNQGLSASDPAFHRKRPLVVDADGILLSTPQYAETAISEIAHRPQALFRLLGAWFGAQWMLRRPMARPAYFDPSRLLYDGEMVGFLLNILGEGRPVYLSSEKYDHAMLGGIAQHLGVFTAWSASDRTNKEDSQPRNLQQFAEQNIDYLGSETVELSASASRIARPIVRPKLAGAKVDLWAWARLLRVHQYAKNALVFLPLLTAHQFALLPAAKALLAALAFCLCASGAYIINDLIDVRADRSHLTKRKRPIASGVISPAPATAVMMLVLAGAVVIASMLSLSFLGILLGYFSLTTAYSLWLKRVVMADVVTLAILYTIRVIAGAIAIEVTMSEWLLAFSLFIFTSLALVKRHIELRGQPADRPTARDYRPDDQSMVAILAAASGFNAVVIFTLYISSDTVRALYTHPQALWMVCPILIYWIGRIMMLAQRELIDDDPVVFALKDRVSWLTLGAIGIVMLAAI
jgi:4-hydroxybenzoate polyprenyltransferase